MKTDEDKFFIFMEHDGKLHQVFLTKEDKTLFNSMLKLFKKPLKVLQKPLGELVQKQEDV